MMQHDIVKLGRRYQIVMTANNEPIGPTFATRGEAESHMWEMESESMKAMIWPPKITSEESASDSVELAEARAKGITY